MKSSGAPFLARFLRREAGIFDRAKPKGISLRTAHPMVENAPRKVR